MDTTLFGTVTLGALIARLKKAMPHNREVTFRFHAPDSYRGYYDHVAFSPSRYHTIHEMIEAAEEALGNTYQGYKGGDFEMRADTPVWIASYGSTGWPLTPELLEMMLADE